MVDDPYDFGSIAAANALSDIYAMGGEVLFAINLVAFPDTLDMSILQEIMRGGAEKVAEAGAVVAGGHSVNDKEPKYGLAVTGIIDPEQLKRKRGALPGDALVLTKPLGTGVVTTALKAQKASEADVNAAVESMKQLNRAASRAALQHDAHAMTDITGFGLLGHALEMARQGQVDFQFRLADMPWLPGAISYAAGGSFPGGMGNNQRHFGPAVSFADGIEFMMQDLLFTPETSGGLLVALAPDTVDAFLTELGTGTIIGTVVEGDGHVWVS